MTESSRDLQVSRLYRLAENHVRKGRLSQGESLFKRVLAAVPGGVKEPAKLRARRFQAMVALGRYEQAVAQGELTLDAGPALEDLLVFRNPWTQSPGSAELSRHEAILDSLTAGGAAAVWLAYYKEIIRPNPTGLDGLLSRLPARRYAWMRWQIGYRFLQTLDFGKAAALFKHVLRHQKPLVWPAHGHLAEAYLCQGERRRALAELDLAVEHAPRGERGDALGWRGEVRLWLGDYEGAMEDLDEACSLGCHWAHCWRGAAKLKLGRSKEALADLDLALANHPDDREAAVWRAEARRESGDHKGCLGDLEPEPAGLWALFNRALAKKALKDLEGMRRDADAIPPAVIAHVRKRLRLKKQASLEVLLRGGLRLARGYRRQDSYAAFIWMSRPRM